LKESRTLSYDGRPIVGRLYSLPYVPAIDGLRALAIAAVLLYHAGYNWIPGGFLGVEVFFVISGYLITSMLLADRNSRRGVSLTVFWQRRARRLLAAMTTLVIGVLTFYVVFHADGVAEIRGDAVAALTYVSNWYLIFENQSYFETLGRPSPLQHLWSLAVEEQFYIIWPIAFALVVGRLKTRAAVTVILAGATASTLLMAVMYEPLTDPSRIYYGTDTRAAGLLIGAALAFVWVPGRLPSVASAAPHIPDTFGLLALAGLAVLCLMVSEFDAFLYQGGFAVTSVLTAALIAAAVHPGARLLHAVLGWRPLVWVGLRSYSIYLWHWPVFVFTRPGVDVQLDGLELFALRLGITLVLAELSYRLVETPVRRGALGRAWRALRRPGWVLSPSSLRPLVTGAGALASVGVLTISVASADPPPPPPSLAAEEIRTVSWSDIQVESRREYLASFVRPSPLPSPVPTLAPTPVPETSTPVITPAGIPATAPAPYVPPPPPTPSGIAGPRVFALGESVMLGASPGLMDSIPSLEIDAAISRHVADDLTVLRYRRDTGNLGDVVVLHIGNNGIISQGQFNEIMEILSAVPRVVWLNLKLPDRYWEGPNNDLLAANVPLYANAVLIDWHSAGNSHPEYFLQDGIHLTPQGYPFYAGLIQPYTQ
jgi:peptidoglycan/LPS O-acetylase OafA/YrhL